MSNYLQIGGRGTSAVIALKRWGAPYNLFALTWTNPLTQTMRNITLKWPRAEHGRAWRYLIENDGYRALIDRYRLGTRILMRKFNL